MALHGLRTRNLGAYDYPSDNGDDEPYDIYAYDPFAPRVSDNQPVENHDPGIVGNYIQAIGQGVLNVPGYLASAIEGNNPYDEQNYLDELQANTAKSNKQFSSRPGGDVKYLGGNLSAQDIRNSAESLGSSFASAVPAFGGGALGGAALGSMVSPGIGTAIGAGIGSLLSLPVMKRATGNQFIRQVADNEVAKENEARAKLGHPELTPEETQGLRLATQQRLNESGDPDLYGIAEAAPEAISSAIEAGIMATPFGKIAKSVGTIGNPLLRAGASALGKVAAINASEQAEEQATSLMQNPINSRNDLPEQSPWDTAKQTLIATGPMSLFGGIHGGIHSFKTKPEAEPVPVSPLTGEEIPTTEPENNQPGILENAALQSAVVGVRPNTPPFAPEATVSDVIDEPIQTPAQDEVAQNNALPDEIIGGFNQSIRDSLQKTIDKLVANGLSPEEAQLETLRIYELVDDQNQSQPTVTTNDQPETKVESNTNTISDAFKGLGQGTTENLYGGLFESLQKGSDRFAGIKDPVLKKSRPFYEAGLINSADDLKAFIKDSSPFISAYEALHEQTQPNQETEKTGQEAQDPSGLSGPDTRESSDTNLGGNEPRTGFSADASGLPGNAPGLPEDTVDNTGERIPEELAGNLLPESDVEENATSDQLDEQPQVKEFYNARDAYLWRSSQNLSADKYPIQVQANGTTNKYTIELPPQPTQEKSNGESTKPEETSPSNATDETGQNEERLLENTAPEPEDVPASEGEGAFTPTHTDEYGTPYQHLGGDEYLDSENQVWNFEPEELTQLNDPSRQNQPTPEQSSATGGNSRNAEPSIGQTGSAVEPATDQTENQDQIETEQPKPIAAGDAVNVDGETYTVKTLGTKNARVIKSNGQEKLVPISKLQPQEIARNDNAQTEIQTSPDETSTGTQPEISGESTPESSQVQSNVKVPKVEDQQVQAEATQQLPDTDAQSVATELPELEGLSDKPDVNTEKSNFIYANIDKYPIGYFASLLSQNTQPTLADKKFAAQVITKARENIANAQKNQTTSDTQTPQTEAIAQPESVVTESTGQQNPPTNDNPLRQGSVGIKLEAGEKVLTSSGRETTPFPKFQSTKGLTKGHLFKLDQWLMDNATEEAKSRGDDFNAQIFSANRNKPSQSDKDSAEEYLFGTQPDIPKPFLKPLQSGVQQQEKLSQQTTTENAINAQSETQATQPNTRTDTAGNAETLANGKTPTAVSEQAEEVGQDSIDSAHRKVYHWLHSAAKKDNASYEKKVFSKYANALSVASKARLDETIENDLIGLLDNAGVNAPDVLENKEEWLDFVNELSQYNPSTSSKQKTTPPTPDQSVPSGVATEVPHETQPWEMTRDAYVKQSLANNEYKDSYESDPELLKSFQDNAGQKWRELVLKQAESERLPDNVIDDFVSNYGDKSISLFRGAKEKGIEGWMPKDIRDQKIEQPKLKPYEKSLHERTWKEQRDLINQGMSRKLSQKEWTEEKATHKAAIQKALSNNESVPDNVLADYPDLQNKVSQPVSSFSEKSYNSVVNQKDAVAKATSKKLKTIDNNDDLLSAISKLGGLNADQAQQEGIDPKSLSKRGYGINRVFTKKGKSYDEMAELLRADHNFQIPDANDLVDKVSRAINQGEKIYNPVGYENVAKIQADEKLDQEKAEYVHRLEGLLQTALNHDNEFGTKWHEEILKSPELTDEQISAWEQDFYDDRQYREKAALGNSETETLAQYTQAELEAKQREDDARAKRDSEQARRDEIIRKDQESGFDVFDEMAGNVPKTQDVFGMTNPLEKVEPAEPIKNITPEPTPYKFNKNAKKVLRLYEALDNAKDMEAKTAALNAINEKGDMVKFVNDHWTDIINTKSNKNSPIANGIGFEITDTTTQEQIDAALKDGKVAFKC